MKKLLLLVTAVTGMSISAYAQSFKFDFGSVRAADGYIPVTSGTVYSDETGYGFEAGADVVDVVNRKGTDVTRDYVTSESAFIFSVKLPEGNWKVRLTLGDTQGASRTTVMTEVRRLMVEGLETSKGKTETVEFIANVRTPELSRNNEIKLNRSEYDPVSGTFKKRTWDDRLSIQFNDRRPCVCALEIEPADSSAVTVFLIGDSTVTDQAGGGTWGQYLPRWFDSSVVIANHAESGMTLKGFRFGRRWDKIMESAKPGDYLFIQLGTNDEKSKGHDPMWDSEDRAGDWDRTHSQADKDYVWELATMAVQAQRKGMIPVIVSPMTKIDRKTATATELMTPYGKNAPRAAKLAGCAFIDLWSASREMVEALGKDCLSAYSDGTHTDNYGAYLFSLFIVKGIRENGLGLREHILPGTTDIDPHDPRPLPEEFFTEILANN